MVNRDGLCDCRFVNRSSELKYLPVTWSWMLRRQRRKRLRPPVPTASRCRRISAGRRPEAPTRQRRSPAAVAAFSGRSPPSRCSGSTNASRKKPGQRCDKRNFNYMDKETVVVLYKSLVRSHFECTVAVWSPLAIGHWKSAEKGNKNRLMNVKDYHIQIISSTQTWPWVRFIHGLGWVGSEIFAYEMGWVELGLVARN